MAAPDAPRPKHSLLDRVIRFCLENKLFILLLTVLFIVWGILNAPFDWDLGGVPRDPVPVDAKRVPFFKTGKELRERLNGGTDSGDDD